MLIKKLIINADDFGQSSGINEGIIYSHENGIVTSTSLMVRYSCTNEAVEYAKSNKRLGVGLHVDLGEWKLKNAKWIPVYEVVPINDTKKVKFEILKQLDAFHKLMGHKPSHIDSHQHVHLNETIKPIFIEIAAALNITLRRCSDNVRYCGDFYGQTISGSPFTNAISITGLKNIIEKIKDGITELACHPAKKMDIKTMYQKERETEVETLCNKEIQELLKNKKIKLCSFEGIPFN